MFKNILNEQELLFQVKKDLRVVEKQKSVSLGDILPSQIKKYHNLFEQVFSKKKMNFKKSIIVFEKTLTESSKLKENWNKGIKLCRNTLPGKTGEDVLIMINMAIQTPPAFSNHELVGFPINAIFIELMQNAHGRQLFADPKINQALKPIMADYNNMLNSEKSLLFMNEEEPHGWFCASAKQEIDYSLYICNPSKLNYGFKNWNSWFLRDFKEGVRKVGEGSPQGISPENIVVNSCESTPLSLPFQPVRNVKLSDNFKLKDNCYSLSDIFSSEKHQKYNLAKQFEGGIVYQAFLSAVCYHKWHAPVSGKIVDSFMVQGTYFLDHSDVLDHYDEGSPNDSQAFLSSVASRHIFILEAENKLLGKIALVYIGMAEVSSCIPIVKKGDYVKQGQKIGRFEFGGSTHVMIFQQHVKLNFESSLYQQQGNDKKAIRQNLGSYLAHIN